MLVLRGAYDAFSPLDLVRQDTANMPNAHIVLVPHYGHYVFEGDVCLRDARNQWLLHPQDAPDFAACLQTLPPAQGPRVAAVIVFPTTSATSRDV
jgi:hypothetical protein